VSGVGTEKLHSGFGFRVSEAKGVISLTVCSGMQCAHLKRRVFLKHEPPYFFVEFGHSRIRSGALVKGLEFRGWGSGVKVCGFRSVGLQFSGGKSDRKDGSHGFH
jgi:hypothetical protein